jgi:hypothetical protein
VVAALARARQVAELAELVGDATLSRTDRSYLRFRERLERVMLAQATDESRSLDETLARRDARPGLAGAGGAAAARAVDAPDRRDPPAAARPAGVAVITAGGGRAGLAQPATASPARLAVDWHGEMGVRFPVAIRCELPLPVPVAGSSALTRTASAHAAAIRAAARHAAADRAVQLVSAATTRRLHRALDAHVVPALAVALRAVEAQLDEFDREENLRVRWAAGLIGGSAER